MDPKRPTRSPLDDSDRDGENPATPPYRDEPGMGKANEGRDEQGRDITEAEDPGLDPTEPADQDLDSSSKGKSRD